MRETRFITQNKEKWLESEKLLSSTTKDPEKINSLFTQVVDDLSYSKTYYPNRTVKVYLNKIAREYFSIIYSHQKEKRNRFRLFWLDELPQIIIYSKKHLIVSFLVFLLSATIGVFSSMKDKQFASTILGDTYVAMTKENIEKGDPMAVYKASHQIDMFLGITVNNLMVAFRTYVFGIFLSIGSIAILLYNGVMVGCFQYFFIERGLFVESALTIWLHGTLEISSIILAGGAGITLGSGLVFPGTYSRLQAFQLSAVRSLKLMLGITPIFIVAALIESFLTRYTEAPDLLRLFLILLSAAYIIGYFIIYPWWKSKRGFEVPLKETRLAAEVKYSINTGEIKGNADLIKDAFYYYKRHTNKLFGWQVIASILMTVAITFIPDEQITERYFANWWDYLVGNIFYAMHTPSMSFVVINSLGTAFVIYFSQSIVDSEIKNKTLKFFSWKAILQTLVLTFISYVCLYALEGFGVLLLLIAFLWILLINFTQITENENLFTSIGKAWKLATSNFSQVIGLQFVLLLMIVSFLMILSAPIIYLYTSLLEWNFANSDNWAMGVIRFIEVFIKILAFNLVLPLLTSSASYLYFSLSEIAGAQSLKEAIAAIGERGMHKKEK